MKNITTFALAVLLSILVSSCSIAAGIFKAGVGFGILIIIAIIAAIIILINKAGKK